MTEDGGKETQDERKKRPNIRREGKKNERTDNTKRKGKEEESKE
jgi:hypothetical protein